MIQIPEAAIRGRVEQARNGGWLTVRPTSEGDLIKLLTVDLHQGEVEAIALTLETKADWLLIDEKAGREMARRLGLPITGVLGVLLRATRMGHIAEIKPDLLALRSKARFFIAPELEAEILASAGEQIDLFGQLNAEVDASARTHRGIAHSRGVQPSKTRATQMFAWQRVNRTRCTELRC